MGKSGYFRKYTQYYAQTDEKVIARGMLEKLLGDVKFSKALDVGAGAGEMTLPLYQRASALTLLEKRPEYEEKLSALFPGACVLIDSINEAQFSDRFDCILYSHGLYYQKDWMAICNQLLNLLSPGGKLIVIMNVDSGDWWSLVSKYSAIKEFSYTPFSQFKKELEKKLKMDSHPFSYSVGFGSADELISFIGETVLGISKAEVFMEHFESISFDARRFLQKYGSFKMKWDAEILVIQK